MRSTLLVFIIYSLLATVSRAEGVSMDFNQHVRPILSDACYSCHGPDDADRAAGLRLDTEAGLFGDLGDGVFPVVPGDPEKSEILYRIHADDPDEVMPPPDAPSQLTDEQRRVLKQWIKEGARWEKHWAFVPPRRPDVPAGESLGEHADWAHNEIDYFVAQRFAAEALVPSAEAGRETWARRVSLSLTGLPPDPSLVKAFLADADPGAHARVVDQLLGTDAYGERMTGIWLDAARYADTNGYQDDRTRTQWPWRDWVIEAFRSNMGFDQFTIEQLAGDLLPDATMEQRLATGFNRNHRVNTEGGIVSAEFEAEYVMDRVETTAANWLGLTMSCARCHDHKYDPVSQREYFKIYDFFNDIDENGRDGHLFSIPYMYWLPETHRKREVKLAKLAEEATAAAQWDAPQWAKEEKGATLPEDAILDYELVQVGEIRNQASDAGHAERRGTVPEKPADIGGTPYEPSEDGYLSFGRTVGVLDAQKPFSIHLRLRIPEGLPATGSLVNRFVNNGTVEPGYDLFLKNGHLKFRLSKLYILKAGYAVSTIRPLPTGEWIDLVVTGDGSGSGFGVSFWVAGQPLATEVEVDAPAETFVAHAELRLGKRVGDAGLKGLQFSAFRLFDRVLQSPEISALSGMKKSLTPAYNQGIVRANQAAKTLFHYRKKHGVAVLVMKDMPVSRPSFTFRRGSYADPDLDDPLSAGIPKALGSLPPDARPDRLGLARWLVSPDNPLTARVYVNRLWQQHFGRGLVDTPEDFGLQGAYPSHRDLLDWLAVEFMESGWDINHIHRKIVLSSTFRQHSAVTPDRLERDPHNVLLARGPRFRLDAPLIRDQALAASGLLVRTVGGPPVQPYQTKGLWREISNAAYVQGKGDDLHRRSLYTFWKRTIAPPRMATFDAAGREVCTVRTTRTNTPMQALTLLNDPTYVEAARALAGRLLEGKLSDRARLNRGTTLLLGHPLPTASADVLIASLARYRATFRDNPEQATALLKNGASANPEGDPAEQAVWTAVAMVLLNLDETVTFE